VHTASYYPVIPSHAIYYTLPCTVTQISRDISSLSSLSSPPFLTDLIQTSFKSESCLEQLCVSPPPLQVWIFHFSLKSFFSCMFNSCVTNYIVKSISISTLKITFFLLAYSKHSSKSIHYLACSIHHVYHMFKSPK